MLANTHQLERARGAPEELEAVVHGDGVLRVLSGLVDDRAGSLKTT